jgi:tetratricopeptide (TPR) repeat protein/transcriptional regulator with XRE-family HTH domain
MAIAQTLSLGALLKRYRRAAGLTQEVLAERAGYSAVYIGMLERGERTPQRTTIEALAEALGLDPHERAHLMAGERGQERRSVSSAAFPHDRAAPRTRLVGRARELALLERHLSAATGQEPPLLALGGEPGIGKTRLLRETAARASAQRLSVLYGGCHRRGGQEPYAPLLEALERHIHSQPPAGLRKSLEGCSWLVRLLPELGEQALVPLPQWTLPPEQERRLMFKAVARYLANAAGAVGTLLLLDDLQWAEADALDLLATLARSTAHAAVPLHIVGAYRDTEVRPADPLGVLLEDLGRGELAVGVKIGPLAAVEANELLVELLSGVEDAAGGRDALASHVLRRAGGVPLFLVSCAQALRAGALEAGAADVDAVPRDVAQGVQQRVAALPESARELLGVAAVVGWRARRSLLLAAAGWSGRGESEALGGLEAACRAGLLMEEGEDAYVFSHDLMREAIASELSTARRAALHRQVAEALEQEPGEPPVERLAYHYARAGNAEKAVVYLERAGDRARSAQAHADACRYYRELVARLEELDRPAQAARAREKLAAMLKIAADYEAALEALEGAVEIYRAARDLEGLARATAQLARMHINRGAPEEGLARLEALIASLDASGLSTGTLAEVYVALGVLYDNSGRYAEALAAAERGGALAEAASDTRLLGQATRLRGAVLNMLGRTEEGVPVLERAIPLLEAAGELRDVCFTLNHMAWVYDITGQFEPAWQCFDRAVGVAERLGDPAVLASMLCNRGDIDFSRGEWERARQDFERGGAMVGEADTSWVSPYPRIAMGLLLLAQGQWEAATQHIEEAIALAERTANLEVLRWAHGALAERELLEGRAEAVVAARSRLEGLLDRGGQEEMDVTRLLPLLAWACLEAGDEERAGALLAQATARASAVQLRPTLVHALRIRALLAVRQARWLEEEAALEEALALCRAMPYPYAEAKTLYVYGLMHLARGELVPARERLEAARAICAPLGERLYAERVEEALAGIVG